MFSIGEKIVCVDVSGCPELVQDKIYTCLDLIIECTCKVTGVYIGTRAQRFSGRALCQCGRRFETNDDRQTYKVSRFVPLQEYTANESAVNELVKESIENIYDK